MVRWVSYNDDMPSESWEFIVTFGAMSWDCKILGCSNLITLLVMCFGRISIASGIKRLVSVVFLHRKIAVLTDQISMHLNNLQQRGVLRIWY